MAKYSFEFKKMVVNEYLNGEGSFETLARKHGIPSSTRIKEWVANFERFGAVSLMRSRQRKVYTFEFKLHVVELYLTSELSYQELALQVGVTNPCTIVQWVNDYRIAGVDALKLRRKGRKRTMDKEKIIHEIEEGDSEDQKELLKQLQEDNLRLRIENAYLKELRRLRLEEEALLRKKRESSAASEENLN